MPYDKTRTIPVLTNSVEYTKLVLHEIYTRSIQEKVSHRTNILNFIKLLPVTELDMNVYPNDRIII